MMRSMYAGVAGLKVHQMRMDVIGNNIANVNTVGFKSSRVTFKEMLSQTLQGAKAPQGNRGGINPQQVGLGVCLGSIDTNQTQGNLQSTGLGSDLAIQGNGFFIVNNGQQNLYTRAGSLSLDDVGNLVNASNGYIIQGWMADSSGNINTNNTIQGIKIPIGQSMNAKATENVTFGGNVDSRATAGATRTATIDVFDSLGKKHTMSLKFQRLVSSSPDDTITVGATTGDVTASASSASLELNGLTISFGVDSDAAVAASYDSASNTVTVTADWDNSAGNAPGLLSDIENAINTELGVAGFSNTITLASTVGFDAAEFNGASDLVLSAPPSNEWSWQATGVTDSSTYSGSGSIIFDTNGNISSGRTGTITFDPTGGAALAQIVNIDFADANNPITQSAADYTIDGIYADGYEMGDLESFTINSSGVITGGFSNGLTRSLGQIAIANFSNPSGLTKSGDTLFAESENSGIPQVGVAANGGRGKILAGTLEMANVDLADQFTEMITTQRGFQANSKIITTADQMLQDLVNLKR